MEGKLQLKMIQTIMSSLKEELIDELMPSIGDTFTCDVTGDMIKVIDVTSGDGQVLKPWPHVIYVRVTLDDDADEHFNVTLPEWVNLVINHTTSHDDMHSTLVDLYERSGTNRPSNQHAIKNRRTRRMT